MSRAAPSRRQDYAAFMQIGTRWIDNDIYGHMNNAVHYQLFDTAVNGHLVKEGVLDIVHSTEVFLVVETGCRYHAEIAFPDMVTAGIAVEKLGNSSVKYRVGLFRNDDETVAAEGFFVHVNVERATHKPVPINDAARAVMTVLIKEQAEV